MAREARRYQRIRRSVLGASVAMTLALPVWHLHALNTESNGKAANGTWSHVAEAFPSSVPPVVGAPWTVRFGPLEVLDPLAAAHLFAAGVGGWRVALMTLPALLLLLAFGRFFCGWLCPYLPFLAASNAVRELLLRFKILPRDARLPRRLAVGVLAFSLLATAFLGSQLLPMVYPPSVIGRELFRAVFFGGVGAGALFLVLAFVFDTFVSRAGFCRYHCPGGALFSLLALASPLRLRRSQPACTDCTLCDRACNLLQQPMSDAVDFSCERCGKCVAACPTDALQWSLGRPLLLESFKNPPPGGRS